MLVVSGRPNGKARVVVAGGGKIFVPFEDEALCEVEG